ncbi:galactosylceramide sulfotransferase-like isoform X2 [Octopus bimaculoides]|uniref:galactosylceramide sulfotransferase-like isoform X2 n=1 Tax=Octopus bimaculoides TaxID=37653 RepID=UPI0022E9044D|nr:galactosylceramide sulfotransferase-like isoform X2 [Octopus bimaculoides]
MNKLNSIITSDQPHKEMHCFPQEYIIFIKVHKAGSTTVMNILQTFGLKRKLNFILPKENNYLSHEKWSYPSYNKTFNSRILMPPNNEAVHILCNHIVYSYKVFNAILSGRHLAKKRTSQFRKIIQGGYGESDSLQQLSAHIYDFNPFQKDGTKYYSSDKSSCDQNFDKARNHKKLFHERKSNLSERNDYFYFTILREPLQQVISAVFYYDMFPKVAYNKLMKKILSNPNPYSQNRMSFDLGLDSKDFYNVTSIDQFITDIDRDFDLILLMEYFDESMILLRRWLCWDMSDIMYIKKNSGYSKTFVTINYEQRQFFRYNYSLADSRLYEYFYKKFWCKVIEEGPKFWDEVLHFKSIQKTISNYCFSLPRNFTKLAFHFSTSVKKSLDDVEILEIPSSKWNSHFIVNATTCAYMMETELSMISHIRKWEYGFS